MAERLDRLLRSDAPRDIAWGAVLSAQYQVRTALPLLEAALARTYDLSQPAGWAAEQALLDALVQLDARLPAASVRPYFGRWPVQTLILLANATAGRDDMLLPLVRTTSGSRWHVVSNLLMQTRPSGFAFQLLNGLRLKLTVQVVDRDDFSFEGNVSGMTGDHSAACGAPTGAPRSTAVAIVVVQQWQVPRKPFLNISDALGLPSTNSPVWADS